LPITVVLRLEQQEIQGFAKTFTLILSLKNL